ncbi:MAG TPA: MTH938/NDUFAF3 family protein [Patescibacteria group bacterium]|nr:MTH938/NDUFAF3 family protein [Patescibacteria group bacterium]
MPRIGKVSWGEVKIDGRNYHQVLIFGDQVIERRSDKLHELFGTTHQIGDWEKEKLLSGNPEIILVATGWSGLVRLDDGFKKELEKRKIELQTTLTPGVVKRYNQLIKEGKRVNALIHTTC